jgi:hypothetical protein
MEIEADGEFEVDIRHIDLSALDLDERLILQLRIGNDVGEFRIQFNDDGEFEADDDEDDEENDDDDDDDDNIGAYGTTRCLRLTVDQAPSSRVRHTDNKPRAPKWRSGFVHMGL